MIIPVHCLNKAGTFQRDQNVKEKLDFETKIFKSDHPLKPRRFIAVKLASGGREEGKRVYANGDLYEGELKNDLREGFGKYIKVVYVYEGQFKDNLEDGVGKCIYGSGLVYEGECKKGEQHGVGKLTWPNGDRYEGEFVENEYGSKGKFTYANGNRLEFDKKCTKYILKNGTAYEGEFIKLNPHFKTTFIWTDGNGTFVLPHKMGTLTSLNGELYVGEFHEGNRQGHGFQKYANGACYMGDWKNDKHEGFGMYSFPDREVQIGNFKNDQFEGKIIQENAEIIEDSRSKL